jgi:hypothetical protein
MRLSRLLSVTGLVSVFVAVLFSAPAAAQGLGGAGTVQGTVKDSTGAVMVAVTVDISNAVSTGNTNNANSVALIRPPIANVDVYPEEL